MQCNRHTAQPHTKPYVSGPSRGAERSLSRLDGAGAEQSASLFSAMALVVLSGLPCSGKSTAAAELAALVEELSGGEGEAPLRAVVVDDVACEALGGRAAVYGAMVREKDARAALRSAVDRAMSPSSVVLVDAMNAIKGYRYELWCIARAAGARYCVLHCDARAADCERRNARRRQQGVGGDCWPAPVLQDLCARFERPDARNRWDKPLFTLHADDEERGQSASAASGEVERAGIGVERVLPSIATPSGCVVHGATERQPRAEALRAAAEHVLGKGSTKASAGGAGGGAGKLTPALATAAQRPAGNANALAELDAAANRVIEAVMAAQSASGGAAGRLTFGTDVIELHRPLPLPALRRYKRGFARLVNGQIGGGAAAPQGLAAEGMFAAYVVSSSEVEGAARG